MSSLRDFATLQTRVYEFLAQQDEKTLHGIASGKVRLAVLPGEATSARHGDEGIAASRTQAGPTPVPADDPAQVALDLSRLRTDQERRDHLNATGLRVSGLRQVAKLRGLASYSKLPRAELVELLAAHDPGTTETGPASPASARTTVGRRTRDEDAHSSKAEPDVNVADVAARLREIETESEGATYLRSQKLNRAALLAVAAELQLTRVDRLRQAELEKRILQQAIGARRRFAGLRKW
ncbi:hypothetical protein [Amycolatopsis thermoflava]|uniref:hypothetical protein n=1 Tax=Amycolatopsis thermoflava TaxID=84480 RepID=UPI003827B52D